MLNCARGDVMRPVLLLAFLAAPVSAQENARIWDYSYPSRSTPASVTLHAPTDPAADASLTFVNRPVHENDEAFSLTWDGITVEVLFGFNVDAEGSESVTVLPPAGYVAIPAEMSVMENETRTLHIFKWRGGHFGHCARQAS